MSYKHPNLPSPEAYKEEKADFWEIQAVRKSGMYVSLTEISKTLSVGLNELEHEGIESEDDKVDDDLDDTFIELSNRLRYTNQRYPFVLKTFSLALSETSSDHRYVYLYLLLATRFNMTTQKVQGGIDGTLLFEELCCEVIKEYMGDDGQSFIFGTAIPGNFEDKVNNLIKLTGEGDSFINPDKNSPTKNDDAIDVVGWRDFADKRIGKLIAFGQCKTGTSSWRSDKVKLNPTQFCSRWLSRDPVHIPIPLLFITDTMTEDSNFYLDQQGYIIFNRFRIMQFLPDELSKTILTKIQTWVNSALQKV